MSFVPLASANSLHVEVTVADREYREGDTVTIQMTVFKNGVPVDVGANDTVRLWVSHHHNLNNPSALAVTSTGTGTYSANYTILADDHHLFFYHQVIVDGLADAAEHHDDAVYIDVSRFENTVDVNFYGQEMITAKPGDTVTATVEVRYGNDLLTPESFDELVLIDPEGTESQLTPTLVSTGYYTVQVSIPAATEDSGLWQIYAHPNTGGHDTAYIQVDVLSVWYRPVEVVGDDIVQFEVGVADTNGVPVNGATIAIERWNDMETETTNESGLAFFSISGIHDSAEIEGFVRSGSLNQSFEGILYNPQGADPGHDLYIYYNGDQDIYRTSESVSRNYIVYYDHDPVADHPIYYYVTATGTDFADVPLEHVDGPFSVVANGVATTDNQGRFTMNFDAPAQQCRLDIRFEVDLTSLGADYTEWPEHHWDNDGAWAIVAGGNYIDDETVKISTSSYGIEEAPEIEGLRVTVEMPTDLDDVTICRWYHGQPDFESHTWEQEQVWIPWTSTEIALTQAEDGTYTGHFLIPAFLNAEKVTLTSGYTDGDTGTPHFNHLAADTGGGGGSLIIILLIVVILVVGVFILLKQFKGPGAKPYKPRIQTEMDSGSGDAPAGQQPADTPPESGQQ